MMTWRWGDWAWWVFEIVSHHSQGFWACLGDLPLESPDGRSLEFTAETTRPYTQLRYHQVR